MELASFCSRQFSAKDWVNTHEYVRSVTLERQIAENELQLQLAAEDIALAIQDTCSAHLVQVPAAVLECSQAMASAGILKENIVRLVQDAQCAHRQATATVDTLRQIEMVKRNMESAYATLKEATELSDVFLRVESVFANGDIAAIAEALATIRRALLIVGNVPEFEGGMLRLQALEDRFQQLVEGSLAAAFSAKDRPRVASLVSLLLKIDRYEVVAKMYITARLTPLQKLWDSYDLKEDVFSKWAAEFYAEALQTMAAERNWLDETLPGHASALSCSLIIALFARIAKSYRMRLNKALEPGSCSVGGPLQVIADLQHEASHFLQSVVLMTPDWPAGEMSHIRQLIFGALADELDRYEELQNYQLALTADGVGLPNPNTDEVSSIFKGWATAVAGFAAKAVYGSDICLQLTGFLDALGFLHAVDAALQQLLHALLEGLRALQCRMQLLGQQAKDTKPDSCLDNVRAAQLDNYTSLIPLLPVLGQIRAKVDTLDASFRGMLSKVDASFTRLVHEGDTLSGWRLQHRQALASRVQSESQLATGPRYQSLPAACGVLVMLDQEGKAVVYEALVAQVKADLDDLIHLTVWVKDDTANEFNLPTFSAYPNAYVTAAGEYLMMLPAVLETALMQANDLAQSTLDGEWLDQVAAGASDHYVRLLDSLPVLSATGSQQLAADLEYFCNVMLAMGVELSSSIKSWQVACAWNIETYWDEAANASATNSLDQNIIRAIAAKRCVVVQPLNSSIKDAIC